MADYQAMYTALFRKITAVIEELQDVQRQTEEMYVCTGPPDIKVLAMMRAEDKGYGEKKPESST